MTSGSEATPSLTALDWIAVVVDALMTLAVFGLALVMPRFSAMFADFGSDYALPLLTRVVLNPLYAATGILPLALTLFGVLPRGGLGVRRAALVGAFVVGLLLIGLAYTGVYLPIAQLSGSIAA